MGARFSTPYFWTLLCLSVLLSCSDKAYKLQNDNFFVGTESATEGSTVEGNLMATAIKESNDLDVVFYPSRLIQSSSMAFLSSTAGQARDNSFLDIYPKGIKDQFIIGQMKGKDIQKFLMERSSENFETDLQVAGMNYHIHYVGGWPQYSYFSAGKGREFDSEKVYRVAVSKYYYFSGETFPSYKYRNGLWISNFREDTLISARESLQRYLNSEREWPFLREPRANVTKSVVKNSAKVSIPKIQGSAFRSEYTGHKVVTTGVVTAQGSLDRYPGGEEAYIQDPTGDNNPLTSDALHLHYRDMGVVLEQGDLVEVHGVVYEHKMEEGLSRTGLRDITKIKVLKKNRPLPAPVKLGNAGRKIPTKKFSSWRGNLNNKPELNLKDAIDFWESLEGMRVQINDPRIVGFRGGNEEFYRQSPKGYLTLYILADGRETNYKTTPAGGVTIDGPKDDYNPQIMQIISNHFTTGIETDAYYDVGGQINGTVTGLLGYESNLFGGGEYSMMITEKQDSLDEFVSNNRTRTELTDRPKTSFDAGPNQLTVAAFNVENLAGFQDDRVREISYSLSENLKCPNIISLVEVQDENGTDFRGDSSPRVTLENIAREIDCPNSNYEALFVAPYINSDGGQPGGNIQVAFLYDANKVGFTERGQLDPLMDDYITPDGSLQNNPARLYARHPEFKGTRKSVIAEFTFKGEKVFVMANHLNSKFRDSSMWGAEQPVYYGSEVKRRRRAMLLNTYIKNITAMAPDAHMIALGDFNAFAHENSMKIFAGQELVNLASYKDLLPFNDRYTYNYNGNSQAIDHIFVGKSLLMKNPKIEIPHINTDYMGRIADHDPILALFTF